MGTRWRGLLAPINKPTGDGRRMAPGAFTHRPLPLPLKWQREDNMGHDDSVVVGLMDTITIDEDAGEVWGEGELFDDQTHLERLTQDVGEAKLLTSKKVIGPSVDAGEFAAILVKPGSNEPLTEEEMEEAFFDPDAELEVLFTLYEIAAATLVPIPAFAEARPFELLEPVAVTAATHVPASPAQVAALTAAAGPLLYPPDAFATPALATYTEITVEDRGEGFLRVVGHFAPEGTCSLEFRDVCITPPESGTDYVPFHRYPAECADGSLIGVGRITTGFGRAGTGCSCCPGKADHACGWKTFAGAITHHDGLTTLAYVRAFEDAHGRGVVGVAVPDLTPEGRQVLEGRDFSGDWRDFGGRLELTELLAYTGGQPAFPPPRLAVRAGRGFSLTAAYPAPPAVRQKAALGVFGRAMTDAMAAAVGEALAPLRSAVHDAARLLRAGQPDPADALTAAVGDAHTGAMIALRMTDDDAARLAVDGGEPADELHLTVAYLGEAADLDDDTRTRIVAALRLALDDNMPCDDPDGCPEPGTVDGDGFAVSVFNPGDNDRDTAIVLGVGGEGLAALHTRVSGALAEMDGYTLPDQHSPWAAHITLAYSDDLALVEQLTDRVGPVTFDRLRVAFGGAVTDLPLATPSQEAAALAAEITAALAADRADQRTREAAALAAQLEEALT